MRGMDRIRVGRRALLVAASACLVAKRVSAADPVDARPALTADPSTRFALSR